MAVAVAVADTVADTVVVAVAVAARYSGSSTARVGGTVDDRFRTHRPTKQLTFINNIAIRYV